MPNIKMKELSQFSTLEGGQDPDFPIPRRKYRWKPLRRKPQDPLEEILHLASQQGDRRFSRVLQWYQRIANSFKSELLSAVCYINTTDGKEMTFQDSESLSACFTKIHNELEAFRPGLRICAFSTGESNFQSAYGFFYGIYLILIQRNDEADRIFQVVMSCLLSSAWASDSLERMMLMQVILQSRILPKPWESKLPSLRRQIRASPKNAFQMVQDSTVTDLLHDTNYLQFQWFHEMPHWDSDLDVYVWEPSKTRPVLDFVRLLILRCDDSKERKVVIAVSAPEILRCLVEKNETTEESVASSQVANGQLISLIHGILTNIRSDTLSFLTDANSKLEDINIASRRRPSNGKMQLLQHLQECYEALACSLEKIAQTASQVVNSADALGLNDDAGVGDVLKGIGEYEDDFVHLANELLEEAQTVPPIKRLVKEQMELSQNSRSTVIGLLVALYVPLAFATSLFGMNINGSPAVFTTNQTYSVQLNASTSHDSVLRERDTTPKNPTTHKNTAPPNLTYFYTSNTGARNWEFSTFWATAVPLAFLTIIVPLVIGPTVRWIIRFAHDHKVWWRILAFCAMVITILIVNAPGWAYARVLLHTDWNLLWNIDPFPYTEYNRMQGILGRLGQAALGLNAINGFTVTVISLWHLYVSRKLRLRWPISLTWASVLVLGCGLALSDVAQLQYAGWFWSEYNNPHLGYSTGVAILLAVLPIIPWAVILLISVIKPTWLWSRQRYRRQRKQLMLEKDAPPPYMAIDIPRRNIARRGIASIGLLGHALRRESHSRAELVSDQVTQ